ncbi:bifunctional metallophosphatase/5'-nucleotidase [Mycoplasma elephantis]|uniref:bifunctional metallophosphatase/5'-nucleotidase n=1 Tax=Mycoplasma elephantis TaxID=114882 RepID=UPI000487D166|nr:bifunctional UDP-sugar hydrolase/5'-nucleotidase [Mycoplasma elephantis]
MKKKILWSLGVLSTILVAPISIVSCQQNNFKEDAKNLELKRNEYINSYKKFNDSIDEKVKILKNKKDAINKEKDKDNRKKLIEEKDKWVKEQTQTLQQLRKDANDKFNNLRNAQKGFEKQIIKIIHTNDEHGRLVFDDGKYNNYSGMQGLAEILGLNMDRDLLVSAGDTIQGQPLSDMDKGKTICKVASLAGYEAIAVGNHEFDYGLEHLFEIQRTNEKMPFLSCNVVWNKKAEDEKVKTYDNKDAKEGERVFKPYIIKELESGLKIGIIGITTPDTKFTSHPKNSVNVTFLEPIDEANKVAVELKNKGINFVVVLTHLGVDRNDANWDAREFAKKVENIDLVLDGHSHTYVPIEKVNNKDTYLTQALCYTKYLSELDITLDTQTGTIENINQRLRPIEEIELLGGKENKNQEISKLIIDLKEEFKKEYEKVVFNLPINLTHERAKQTNLGMFASDAIAWDFVKNNPKINNQVINFDLDNVIGLFNSGGLRQNIPAGDVKKGDVLGVCPFGNRIAAVQVKGNVLLEMIKHGSNVGSGGFAQYSRNVKGEIKLASETNGKKIYAIDESTILINDKPIDINKDYYVVTNDFILVGGDNYTMLDYTKNPDKAKLVFEGGDLLESLIEYGKLITATNFTPALNNVFGDKAISLYDNSSIPKNIIVNL